MIEGTRTDDETNLINELQMLTKDLDYLHDEIESSLQRFPGVYRDIREHLDLLQIRRTSILGILAGLYLPLSFVTVSFLIYSTLNFIPSNSFDFRAFWV